MVKESNWKAWPLYSLPFGQKFMIQFNSAASPKGMLQTFWLFEQFRSENLKGKKKKHREFGVLHGTNWNAIFLKTSVFSSYIYLPYHKPG